MKDSIRRISGVKYPRHGGFNTELTTELGYTGDTLKLRPVKLLFVVFGRLSYSFFTD